MEWRWQRVKATEAARFLEVSIGTFRAAFEQAYAEERENYEAYIAETYTLDKVRDVLEAPQENVYWLLAGDETAGLIRFGPTPLLDCLPPKPLIEIKRFYLYPAYHGQGGAAWLLAQVKKWAQDQGYEGIWLIVAEASQRAITFYHKWGFRQVGSTPFRMGDMVEKDRVLLWHWS